MVVRTNDDAVVVHDSAHLDAAHGRLERRVGALDGAELLELEEGE